MRAVPRPAACGDPGEPQEVVDEQLGVSGPRGLVEPGDRVEVQAPQDGAAIDTAARSSTREDTGEPSSRTARQINTFCLTCHGGTFPAYLLWRDIGDKAAERIYRACIESAAGAGKPNRRSRAGATEPMLVASSAPPATPMSTPALVSHRFVCPIVQKRSQTRRRPSTNSWRTEPTSFARAAMRLRSAAHVPWV